MTTNAKKITEEKYLKIKAELKSPADDKRAMKKYGLGASTVRRIRNTRNFYQYCATSTTGRRTRKRIEDGLAGLREEREFIHYEEDSSLDRIIAFTVVILLLCLIIAGVLVTILSARGH